MFSLSYTPIYWWNIIRNSNSIRKFAFVFLLFDFIVKYFFYFEFARTYNKV